MESFGDIFTKNWDILITGLIIAFSFQFILNPNYNFWERIVYPFSAGLLLITIYSSFQWANKSGDKIILLLLTMFWILVWALIFLLKNFKIF